MIQAIGVRFLAAQAVITGGLLIYDPSLWKVATVLAAANIAAGCLLVPRKGQPQVITVRPDEKPIETTLQIASETLPYMRRGLNEETAKKTAEIIQKIGDVAAVAITDRNRVLAFLGPGCDKHPPGKDIVTYATKEVIRTGQLKIAEKKEDLQCPVTDCVCPLEGAIIVPLKMRDEVVGTIKLYRTEKGPIPQVLVKFAVGIAQLLGIQMELAELDRRSQLATRAELDALRAQINPHFLFNTLNTITMFIRTNPEMARRLLIRLATFFRYALKRTGHFSTLAEELECVNNYLILEKARFREKLRFHRDIDRGLCEYMVPVLTLQPLVENAVKHGIAPKIGSGTVRVTVKRQGDEIAIEVSDDGVGIPPDIMSRVFEPGFGSGSGVGLSNVNERLKSLFGEEYGLSIQSEVGKGTTIGFRVPLCKNSVAERGGLSGEA
ncbi:MAG: histidine kinase [Bacillota bacterium]|uniref:histidine kinase n=1 Tax=Desulforudis sp. DRI-14 TaxID=3459793 RepID=UPI00348DBE66